MEPVFLALDEVPSQSTRSWQFQAGKVERRGGTESLRDRGSLESAIAA